MTEDADAEQSAWTARAGSRWILASTAALVPASLAAELSHSKSLTFVFSALAVVPLAALLGQATEELAAHAGPRVGGLLNATFGNAAELIIGLLLVARNQIAVVRASITGSILGNLLLVLGGAFFAGGLRRKELEFSGPAATTLVASMALAVGGLLLPDIYAHAGRGVTEFRIEAISVGVGVVLVLVYTATLLFSLVTHTDAFRPGEGRDEGGDEGGDEAPRWSMRRSWVTLAVAGGLVGLESELLVGALEPTVKAWGLSELWVGLVLVPLVGNAAEHSTAVVLAMKGKAEIAIDIAVGSSAQVALLVTPLLIFAGALSGNHLQLTFTTFEVTAIAFGVAVVALLCLDGRTNWLEGAQLLAVYAILAISSFFL